MKTSRFPFSPLEQAAFGFAAGSDVLPGQLYASFVDSSFSPSALPQLHPAGQHWSEWKSAGIKPTLANEVATNLARAAEIRQVLQNAGSFGSAVLAAPAYLNADRLLQLGEAGQTRRRPRIKLWVEQTRSGDLQVLVDMTRDVGTEAATEGFGTQGTDYRTLPFINLGGRGPANLLAELPAELISTRRGKAPSRALVASKEEVARAVVCGLAQLAQDLNVVCDVSVGDWVVHVRGKYVLMSPDTRVGFRLSQVLQTISCDVVDLFKSISAGLEGLGVRRQDVRDKAICQVLAAGTDIPRGLNVLVPASPEKAVRRLADQFTQLRALIEYGTAMGEISAGHWALHDLEQATAD